MRRSTTVLAIVCVCMAVCVATAIAYNLLGFQWPVGTNVRYRINANTAQVPDEASAVSKAGNTWSSLNSAGLRLTYQGSTSTTTHGYNGSNTVNWTDEGDNSTLGTSYIWYSGNTILETDLVFNDYYNWSTSGSNYDVETVALHEFGHWVGLDHTSSGIMRPNYGGKQHNLDDDAKEGFYAMYGGGGGGEEPPDEPALKLDRYALSFLGKQELFFRIMNSGPGSVDYSISKNKSWILISPISGSSSGEWDDIHVSVETKGLNVGNYSGRITVTSANASNSPQTLSVSLKVINDQPPEISITSPKNNNVVAQKVQVSVNVKDDVGVKKVEFYLDQKLKKSDSNAPFIWLWDSTSTSSGFHTLKVKAFDTIDQTDVDSIRVKVDQPPSVAIASPKSGSHVSGSVEINAPASDDFGLKRVEFYVDSEKKRSDTTQPYKYTWNTSTYNNGSHSLKVIAVDSRNQTTEDKISVLLLPHGPQNFTGQKQNNSSGLLEEYINVLSWQVNPWNQGIIKYKLFVKGSAGWEFLTELSPDVFEHMHRGVNKDEVYEYMLRAVDSENREGEGAYLSIQ
ncbi:Ig-like domain-containing protein [Acidobacteriota bacterium]